MASSISWPLHLRPSGRRYISKRPSNFCAMCIGFMIPGAASYNEFYPSPYQLQALGVPGHQGTELQAARVFAIAHRAGAQQLWPFFVLLFTRVLSTTSLDRCSTVESARLAENDAGCYEVRVEKRQNRAQRRAFIYQEPFKKDSSTVSQYLTK